MPAITFTDLKPLLAEFSGEGQVLSFYGGHGVVEGFRPEWAGLLKSRADAIVKTLGDDGRAIQELDENVFALRNALEARELHASRWIAAFCATRRNFLKVVPLDVPVESDLVVDRSPYLVPLLEAAHRRREYLVVHTDTHRGRIYAATPGEARLLTELDEPVPARQHSAGETWGYGQATIARHRDDRISHYRKDLVREIEHLWETGRFAGLILLGQHQNLQPVRAELPSRILDRIVREAPESWYEKASEIEETIRSLTAGLYTEGEVGVASGFWDRLREEKAVAKGAKVVIDVLQSGRLGPEGHGYLVFGPDPRESVGRCVACRSLTLEPLGPCPKCQAPCAPGNLWEELLLTALQHGIECHFVRDPKKLERYGGLVAVLPEAQVAGP
jgi:hypothetical protein